MDVKGDQDIPTLPNMSEQESTNRDEHTRLSAQSAARTSTGTKNKGHPQKKKDTKKKRKSTKVVEASKNKGPKSKTTGANIKDSESGEERENRPVETAVVDGMGGSAKETTGKLPVVVAAGQTKKKRKANVNIPSEAVLRIGMKAGYKGKEGGLEHIGCCHFSMEQMRKYSIDLKTTRDYYMQANRFLCGTRCHGCPKLADEVDMKNKDPSTRAFIYYCDIGVQEKKPCHWYCRPCFEKDAKEEFEATRGMNGNGRVKRGRHAGVE